MNRIIIIMMIVVVFGLATSTVFAECALHSNNKNVEYNELSAGEFFYGVPLDNVNSTAVASNSGISMAREDAAMASGILPAPEFFYGYTIPNRVGTTDNGCVKTAWNGGAWTGILEIYDPAAFYGYIDVTACSSNC